MTSKLFFKLMYKLMPKYIECKKKSKELNF